jgi:hypothetical protein
MAKSPKFNNVNPLPVSKGSTKLGSPPGETLQEFFYRFMVRKEARTGWRSGRLDKGDTKRPDRTPLDKPFVSLLTALTEAGFVENQDEAEAVLQMLAERESPRMGARRKEGAFRYWIATPEVDEGEF